MNLSKCPSKEMTYYGYKIHLICTLKRSPIKFLLTSANADDRKSVPELISNMRNFTLIADKGYIGNDFQKLLLYDYNVSLIPIKRARSDTYSRKFR